MMRILLIAVMVLGLIGCSKEEEVVVEKHPDGSPKIKVTNQVSGDEKIKINETEFYPNGYKRIFGEFKNGQRTGLWKSWYENGNIWSEGEYLEGQRHGYSKVYHENGKVHYEGHYTHDHQSGKWIFYDQNGKVKKEVNFEP